MSGVSLSPGLVRFGKAFAGKFGDRFEKPVARLPAQSFSSSEQALLEERLERVRVCVRNSLGLGEGAAADEDGETGEQRPLLLREQLVAPLDRCPQGPLSESRPP